MPGKKDRFTEKEDRIAKHIMESEMKRGVPKKEAKSIGYATVVKWKKKKKASRASR